MEEACSDAVRQDSAGCDVATNDGVDLNAACFDVNRRDADPSDLFETRTNPSLFPFDGNSGFLADAYPTSGLPDSEDVASSTARITLKRFRFPGRHAAAPAGPFELAATVDGTEVSSFLGGVNWALLVPEPLTSCASGKAAETIVAKPLQALWSSDA